MNEIICFECSKPLGVSIDVMEQVIFCFDCENVCKEAMI